MRTFDEINADIKATWNKNDPTDLQILAAEMLALGTDAADAAANAASGWVNYLRGDNLGSLERFQHALRLYEKLDDRAGLARVTGNIGLAYDGIGEYALALEHLRRALAFHEELGNRHGMAMVTGVLGMVYKNIGDYARALDQTERALALHEELNDSLSVAWTTNIIGLILNVTADYPRALECFERTLTSCTELGNRSGMAHASGNIASIYAHNGNYPRALELYERALAAHEELGDRKGAAAVMSAIGAVYGLAEDYVRAEEYEKRALAEYEQIGDRAGVALVTDNIVSDLLATHQDANALALLDTQSLLQIDSPEVRSGHYANRATLAERGGNLDSAREYLQLALEIAVDAGSRDYAARYHRRLRDLAQKRNDFAGYIEHNNEYNRITEEIRGKEATQKLAMMEAQRGIEAERRERDKERALLYGTLPKSVADRMIRGEKITGDHYERTSVLFLDIVGFTTIADKIPPGHVVHLLSQIFSTLDEVCKGHGVTKIKTVGDSYMAVAGVPDVLEDHAQRAALCAMEMLAALNALEISMPPELGDTSWIQDVGEIQVRIGLHCGPVTAGVLGTERLQYDVWGDTVNVASRMESTGEPGRIHVSQAFAVALGAGVTPRGELEIKGKGLMKTYWLESTT